MSTVRDTAVVVATSTVDGTVRRRPRTIRRAAGSAAQTLTVDPQVMLAAHAVIREGQRLVIENATSVRLVNITYREDRA